MLANSLFRMSYVNDPIFDEPREHPGFRCSREDERLPAEGLGLGGVGGGRGSAHEVLT
jgi:hypothetical protein